MSCLYGSTPFVYDRTQHSLSLGRFCSRLKAMTRPAQQFIEGHSKITRGIDPKDWLTEELNWSRFVDSLAGLCEEHRGNFRDVDGDPPVSQPPLWVTEILLQVGDEQRWLAGRGYEGRVIRLESHLDVVGCRRHVTDIQTEQDGGNYFSLSQAGPHDTTSGCVCWKKRFERPTMKVRRDSFCKVRG
jgi:hypothetical protein